MISSACGVLIGKAVVSMFTPLSRGSIPDATWETIDTMLWICAPLRLISCRVVTSSPSGRTIPPPRLWIGILRFKFFHAGWSGLSFLDILIADFVKTPGDFAACF